MKLPSFQFFPGDWLKDANLRQCSAAARGVWIDLLCVMFECQDRGVLATGGRAWTDEEIAKSISGDATLTIGCLHELLEKMVASRNRSGAVYCRRMVRDEGHRRANTSRQQRFRDVVRNASVTHDAHLPEGEVEDGESERSVRKTRGVKSTKFVKPTMEEVLLQAAKIGLSQSEAQKFFNYYESNGWRVGKNPMRSWTAAMTNWKLNQGNYGSERGQAAKPNNRNVGTYQTNTNISKAVAKRSFSAQMDQAGSPGTSGST